jgi:hypothetical protein
VSRWAVNFDIMVKLDPVTAEKQIKHDALPMMYRMLYFEGGER